MNPWPLPFFTGAVPAAIAPGKENDVRAIGDDAAKAWTAYGANDAALLELVVKQCAGGISSRQQQTSPPDV